MLGVVETKRRNLMGWNDGWEPISALGGVSPMDYGRVNDGFQLSQSNL
jgi:hypothetical protein